MLHIKFLHQAFRLRKSLPAEVVLLVGGRAMPAWREVQEAIGARPIGTLAQFRSVLDDLRKPGRKAKP